MKIEQEIKTGQGRGEREIFFSSFLLLGFLSLIFFPLLSRAETEVIKQIQTQIQNSQGLLQELDKEISEYQKQLNQVSGQRKTLESTVKELDLTNKRLQTTIRSTSLKIDDTEKNIENLNLSIGEMESRIDRNRFLITSYIQSINELEMKPVVLSVLQEKELSGIVAKLNTYASLQSTLNREIRVFTEELDNLGVAKRTKEEEKIRFEELVEQHKIEKQTIEKNKKEKDILLKETKSEESEYQKIVNEKIALRKQFEESLQKLESELQFILDPNTFPKPAFGIFAWPLDNILITQPFGLTKDSKALYSYRTGAWSGRHTGVDFRANADKVYAMANGTVVDFGNTDTACPKASYGGWMLIKYDNGLSSIYSHLSSFVASKGQKVSAGTLVAISGNTGYSTGPHLDVKIVPTSAVSIQTWPSKGCPGKNYTTPIVAGSTYFDPLGYLPKATPNMFK